MFKLFNVVHSHQVVQGKRGGRSHRLKRVSRPVQNERLKTRADPIRLEIRTLKISFCSKPEEIAWKRIFLNKGNQMYACFSSMNSESKWDQSMTIDLNFGFVHVTCMSLQILDSLGIFLSVEYHMLSFFKIIQGNRWVDFNVIGFYVKW